MNTLYVNFFGAPGAGKSSGAAFVFSKLKLFGINCEYIQEYAKDKVWEDNKFMFNSPENQFYIGAKQFYRLNRLNNKVDVVVTDSPIFLNAFYADDIVLGKEYKTITKRLFERFNNINFFIKRVKPYDNSGRLQTENESDMMSIKIMNFLDKYDIFYDVVDGNEFGYTIILNKILEKSQKR